MFNAEENKHIFDITNLMDSSIPRSVRMARVLHFLSTFQPGNTGNRTCDERNFRRLLNDVMMAPDQTTLFNHFFQFTTYHTMDENQTYHFAEALEENFFRTRKMTVLMTNDVPLAMDDALKSCIDNLMDGIFCGKSGLAHDMVHPPAAIIKEAPKILEADKDWMGPEEKANLQKALAESAKEAGISWEPEEEMEDCVDEDFVWSDLDAGDAFNWDEERRKLAMMQQDFPTMDLDD